MLLLTRQFRSETLLQPYPAALPNSQTATVQDKLEELSLLLGKFSSPQDAHKVLEWANITLRHRKGTNISVLRFIYILNRLNHFVILNVFTISCMYGK